VYTHQSFKLGFNGDKIVFANLTASNLAPFKVGDHIAFTYDVTFEEMTGISFDDRFRRYLDNAFFEHRIHWFSLFNSFMMVLFLGGLVLTVLSRTLRADYARFAREKEELESGGSAEWTDEAGWKQLANDVFRAPVAPLWLAAAVGTGWQLVALFFFMIAISLVSLLYTTPGSVLTYGVLAYAVTSFVAGHVSASVFGDYISVSPVLSSRWLRVFVYTAVAFPGFVLLLGFLLNFVAVAYDSAQAIPFGGMVVMLLLWGVISTPLVFLGTISGRMKRQQQQQSGPAHLHREVTVNPIPRIVPRRPWYLQWPALAITGGILPFGSIFIELYFVFTSFWNYKFYYVYGFMLLVFIILLLSCACVAVVSTYFLLNGEDHRWHWASFGFGATTAGYVYLYAVYFYFFKTKMSGLFMFAYYFGYMTMLCCGLALLCGAVAYSASNLFIVRIYRNVKAD
jgi:transmembrane 9 superfamily protein 3